MHLMASSGQGKMEGQGMALEPTSEVAMRPSLDEEGDLELPGWKVLRERELVPRRREGEEIEGSVMLLRGEDRFNLARGRELRPVDERDR